MKKILALTFLIFLIFLAGCTDTQDTQKPKQKITQEAQTEVETPPAEKVAEEVLPQEPEQEPLDEDIVIVKDFIPDIFVDLKYATEDNFTGKVIYEDGIARLRYGTVKKLLKVQEKLREKEMSILILDAFRPVEAQFRLWEIYPDASFVANPNNGYSSHSRGNTIDLTVVDKNGKEIVMPSEFDEFNSKADRYYGDVSPEAAQNSQMLEDLMEEQGFSGYSAEWWHYVDNVTYPVVE